MSDYDKLLFRTDDFHAPDRSLLRRDLFNSPDRQVRDLTDCLFASAKDAIDRVPHLNDLVTQESCASKSIHPVTVAPITPTVAPPPCHPTKEQAAGSHGAIPQQPPNLWAGRIDGYEFGDLLGKGIRGAVYKAVSKTDRRSVAIKIVPMRRPASENSDSRFLRNMNRDLHLQHPNIVAQFRSGAVDSAFYFVMEYCGGGNLAQRVDRQGGKLRLVEIRPMMQQCLDALKCARLHHVVHGDLKPHNVLFDASPSAPLVKISDFALARNFDSMRFSKRTATDNNPDDLHFTPRERLTSDRDCQPISDLWSLAAVFYHAVTGWFPLDFSGRNAIEVILTEEPVPLQSARCFHPYRCGQRDRPGLADETGPSLSDGGGNEGGVGGSVCLGRFASKCRLTGGSARWHSLGNRCNACHTKPLPCSLLGRSWGESRSCVVIMGAHLQGQYNTYNNVLTTQLLVGISGSGYAPLN